MLNFLSLASPHRWSKHQNEHDKFHKISRRGHHGWPRTPGIAELAKFWTSSFKHIRSPHTPRTCFFSLFISLQKCSLHAQQTADYYLLRGLLILMTPPGQLTPIMCCIIIQRLMLLSLVHIQDKQGSCGENDDEKHQPKTH